MSRDDIQTVIAGFVSVIVVIAIIALLVVAKRCSDDRTWNHGHCTCGGLWQFVEYIGHAYTTTYMYQCDNCGRTHEFHKYYEE